MDTLEKTFAMIVLNIFLYLSHVCHPQINFFWIIYLKMLNEMFVAFYGLK